MTRRMTTLLLLLVAVSLQLPAVADQPASVSDLVAGKVAPFTLKLKDLDSSYFRFAAPGLSEGSSALMSLYGAATPSPCYSRGATVAVAGETYLVAYKLPEKRGDFSTLMFGGARGETAESEEVTEDSAVELCLLNQRTITSMVGVRPFDLKTELANYQQRAEQFREMTGRISAAAGGTREPDRLKELALAVQMYVTDYDKLPPMSDPKAFRKALDDYVENQDVFKDQETNEYYAINASLSGKSLDKIEDPAKVVVAYQAKPGKDGKRGVGFADGSAKRVTESEWAELKKESGIK